MPNKVRMTEFKRNVLTLITGTSIAQAIPIAIAPILTRIYSPEDFGVFALYMAIASIISIAATARYELAIMLPKKESDAMHLVVLSIIITLVISIITLGIIYIFNAPILALLGKSNVGNWLYFIPLTVFLTGVYQSLSYWNNREKKYWRMSVGRVINSGSVSTTQAGLGFLGFLNYGLIIGNVLGQSLATLFLCRHYWKENQVSVLNIRKIKLIANMKRYLDYPKYSVIPSVLDTFSQQAPIFFLAKAYEMTTVGFVGFMMRILAIPAGVIGSSIGQVYFQKISRLAIEEPTRLMKEVVYTSKKLAIVALFIFMPFFIFGEEIISFIFGHDWRVAGQYAEILVVAVYIRFVVSPLSVMFSVTNHVKLGSVWKIIYFFSTIVVMLVAMEFDITVFLWAFVVNEIIMYMIQYLLVLRASESFPKRGMS